MKEAKVAISKLNASYLSKLASSTVSLGQLHELTKKSKANLKAIPEVDNDLLESIKDKILNKASFKEINLEDDQCTLIFTSHKTPNTVDRFKTKKVLDEVKESYYNFRKATLYAQRLNDIRYAINEGLIHEMDIMSSNEYNVNNTDQSSTIPQKSPHTVFKEMFFDNNYDQDLMSQITNLQ